jgi:arylsulfatase
VIAVLLLLISVQEMSVSAIRVLFATLSLLLLSVPAAAQDKPNIVFVFMDNFGYGELGVYGGGITRGGATPQIDALAAEGLRLTNFNVEAQCTPSRSALMTGRYAIRSGNASVPITTGMYGLTQWEVTMAEMLTDAGYATGMFRLRDGHVWQVAPGPYGRPFSD